MKTDDALRQTASEYGFREYVGPSALLDGDVMPIESVRFVQENATIWKVVSGWNISISEGARNTVRRFDTLEEAIVGAYDLLPAEYRIEVATPKGAESGHGPVAGLYTIARANTILNQLRGLSIFAQHTFYIVKVDS